MLSGFLRERDYAGPSGRMPVTGRIHDIQGVFILRNCCIIYYLRENRGCTLKYIYIYSIYMFHVHCFHN